MNKNTEFPTRVYKAQGSVIEFTNHKFTLREMQKIVKGLIEIVRLSPTLVMIVNEEGKIRGLPYNDPATALYRYYLKTKDIIVGDVIVTEAKNID